MADIFDRLAKSDFRSKFKLKQTDKDYVAQKGLDTIERHKLTTLFLNALHRQKSLMTGNKLQ